MKIKLNPEEYRLLIKEVLATSNCIYELSVDKNKRHWLCFEEHNGDLIFDSITDYLQINGFNIDYSINYKGKILEDLMDKFFKIGF